MSVILDGTKHAAATAADVSNPFILGGWFKATASPTLTTFLSIGTDGTTNHRRSVACNASDLTTAVIETTAGSAATAGTVLQNIWQLRIAFFENSTSRYAALNAVFGSQQTTSRVPNAPNETKLGARHNDTQIATGLASGCFKIDVADLTEAQAAANELLYLPADECSIGTVTNYWRFKSDGTDDVGSLDFGFNSEPSYSTDEPPPFIRRHRVMHYRRLSGG